MLVIVDRKKRYGRLLSRFIRRISVSEDAPKEELNRAFDAYKELAYRDIRISHRDLLQLIQTMLTTCEWDHYVYSQMLHLLYEYHSSKVALEVIRQMREFHVKVNSDDYMDAIRVCSVSDNAENEAAILWNWMLSEGYAPSLIDYEILMNCFIRSNDIAEAEKLFESIRHKGLKPTVWTYNTLLNGYKKTGSWERALQMYQIMKLDKIVPDGITYTILLDLLLKMKKQEYGNVIVRDLQGGTNLLDLITNCIQTTYPTHFMDNVNLMNSQEFLDSFNTLFSNESLKKYHDQFSHLFLKKSSLNSLLLWYINQDNRFAVLYLYHCTMRSRKTAPNDLTYKLLFHYCGIKQDSVFYELIMKNAAAQGFTYNVRIRVDFYDRHHLYEMLANIIFS